MRFVSRLLCVLLLGSCASDEAGSESIDEPVFDVSSDGSDAFYQIRPTDTVLAPDLGQPTSDVTGTVDANPIDDSVGTPDTPEGEDAAEEPDTTEWIDAGACGLCPSDRPLCLGGECSCTVASCGTGAKCNGGQCEDCNTSAACGPSCKNCTSQGLICLASGAACAACEGTNGCDSGEHCEQGVCVACNTTAACGASCSPCPSGASCQGGQCIQCTSDFECPGGQCEDGLCVGCSDSDPLHCGPNCNQCGGAIPACVGGLCQCTPTSCGASAACLSGKCTSCKVDAACGPSCLPCAAGTHCIAGGCQECGTTADCGPGNTCEGGDCVPCAADDPLRCGASCTVCGGAIPACVGGKCQCSGGSCGPGALCTGGSCATCDTPAACGSSCSPCAPGKKCAGGACVTCTQNTECGSESVCESGECVSCSASDAAHCGSSCAVCSGPKPICTGGQCECSGASCGTGSICTGGQCAPCNTASTCGASCGACGGGTPYCAGVTAGCVACTGDPHCAGGFVCISNTCAAPCVGVAGCTDDFGPDGKKCGSAEIIGRKTLASAAGYSVTGNTTNAGDDDDLSTNDSDCWDAKYDQFYRFWLRAGETITITADPTSGDSDFDLMMKFYAGTSCKSGGDPLFCKDDKSNGGLESFTHAVTADGWYTVVVDGRSAFDDEYDYGAYAFTARLTNNQAPLCCQ